MLSSQNATLLTMDLPICKNARTVSTDTYMWEIIFVESPSVGGQGGSKGTLTQLPRNTRCDFFQTYVRRCRW